MLQKALKVMMTYKLPVPAGENVLLQLGAQMQQPSCRNAVDKKRVLLASTSIEGWDRRAGAREKGSRRREAGVPRVAGTGKN